MAKTVGRHMSRDYPPGPLNFNAAIGLTWRHAFHLWRDPIAFTQHLHQRYGDFVFFRLFGYEAYLLSHPDLVREVLVTKAKSFIKQPREMSILRRQLQGAGVINSEGAFWLRQRRIMLPAFQVQFAQRLAELVVEEAEFAAVLWNSGQEVRINKAMTDVLVSSVSQALFGVEARSRAQELGEAMTMLSRGIVNEFRTPWRLPDWIPGSEYRQRAAAAQLLNDFIDDVIRRRRANGARSADLISILLDAVDRDGDRRGMTDREARIESLTMFFAGHHTAAATLAWTFYLLDQTPHARQRLEAEVDEVLVGRTPTVSDVQRLPFATAVIKESMRIYPSAWALFGRQATENVDIGDYQLPCGAYVLMSPYIVQRDPRWFLDPLQFEPERFLSKDEYEPDPGSYFPFGMGGHSCLGMRAAMTALPLALASLVQKVRFEVAPTQGPVEPEPLIAICPRGDIRMIAMKRQIGRRLTAKAPQTQAH